MKGFEIAMWSFLLGWTLGFIDKLFEKMWDS